MFNFFKHEFSPLLSGGGGGSGSGGGGGGGGGFVYFFLYSPPLQLLFISPSVFLKEIK